jgi:MraZ protein
VLIPEHLKPIARLKRDVVLLGVSDKIEIWDKEQWEAFSRTEPGEYERSASKAFRRLV